MRGCGTQAQGRALYCIAHGGGKRCQEPGCTTSVRTQRRVLPLPPRSYLTVKATQQECWVLGIAQGWSVCLLAA